MRRGEQIEYDKPCGDFDGHFWRAQVFRPRYEHDRDDAVNAYRRKQQRRQVTEEECQKHVRFAGEQIEAAYVDIEIVKEYDHEAVAIKRQQIHHVQYGKVDERAKLAHLSPHKHEYGKYVGHGAKGQEQYGNVRPQVVQRYVTASVHRNQSCFRKKNCL